MLMLAGLFLPLYLNGQLALLEKEAAPHTERQKADTAKEKQEEKRRQKKKTRRTDR